MSNSQPHKIGPVAPKVKAPETARAEAKVPQEPQAVSKPTPTQATCPQCKISGRPYTVYTSHGAVNRIAGCRCHCRPGSGRV